ncbi:hypothetical protein BGZ67_009073 [Mortierella alpina]|nr:hypothetical protein BGZ67_009073 [Mortierella alpina]
MLRAIVLLVLLCFLATASGSFFAITEHTARNVKCFQSYSDVGLVERSICWHDKEFYADRWHAWPCEVDCDINVPVRIYLEDYTVSSLRGRFFAPGALSKDQRSMFKIYIQRADSEWQLVTYLRKGAGECENRHDEEGWSVWACAEIKAL